MVSAACAYSFFIFHQIWIGPKPFPKKNKQWQKTWQSVPGWKYKLWTNADLKEFRLTNKKLFYKEKNVGARADIFRIQTSDCFGGVYIDTDFELLDPDFFNFLNYAYDFYAGLTPVDSFNKWGLFLVANGIMGAIPGHPILKAYIDNLTKIDVEEKIVVRGPGLLSKMILMHANKGAIRN